MVLQSGISGIRDPGDGCSRQKEDHRQGCDGVIITYGNLVNEAMSAADTLAEQGISVSVLRLTALKPLPQAALKAALKGQKYVLFAEEAMNGIGGDVCTLLHDILPGAAIAAADLGDEYVTHGSVAELYRKHGLDGKSLADRFMEVWGS